MPMLSCCQWKLEIAAFPMKSLQVQGYFTAFRRVLRSYVFPTSESYAEVRYRPHQLNVRIFG